MRDSQRRGGQKKKLNERSLLLSGDEKRTTEHGARDLALVERNERERIEISGALRGKAQRQQNLSRRETNTRSLGTEHAAIT